jgi:hypothetical protein
MMAFHHHRAPESQHTEFAAISRSEIPHFGVNRQNWQKWIAPLFLPTPKIFSPS